MRVVSLVCVVLLLACSDPVAPGLASLVGEWRTLPVALQPRGSMDGRFVVHPDGRSENWTTSRGVYVGQGPGDLSAEVVRYGRITVNGDRFVSYVDSIVTRDVFYGPSYRYVLRGSGEPPDTTRFEVRGNELRLEFYTYPADAPVLTQAVLYRVSPGHPRWLGPLHH